VKTISGSATKPSRQRQKQVEKRCVSCGKKLGQYATEGEAKLAEGFAPIQIKCPRCKKIS
jgi:phage FluMu protein Com